MACSRVGAVGEEKTEEREVRFHCCQGEGVAHMAEVEMNYGRVVSKKNGVDFEATVAGGHDEGRVYRDVAAGRIMVVEKVFYNVGVAVSSCDLEHLCIGGDGLAAFLLRVLLCCFKKRLKSGEVAVTARAQK